MSLTVDQHLNKKCTVLCPLFTLSFTLILLIFWMYCSNLQRCGSLLSPISWFEVSYVVVEIWVIKIIM